MGTPSTVYGFNRPASGDAVSAFQATINADLEEIDGLLKGLADPTYIVGAASGALNNELTLGGGAVLAPVVLGSRPAASLAGRLQAITDLGVLQRDTGSVWATVAALTKSGTVLPTASADGAGSLFLDTDDDAGTLWFNSGASMVQAAAGVGQAPTSHANVHLPSSSDSWQKCIRTTSAQTSADESLDNHLELAFGLAASDIWMFEALLLYESTTTADLKLALTAPAGATGWWAANIAAGTNAASYTSLGNQTILAVNPYTTPITGAVGGLGTGSPLLLVLKGLIVNGSNPGDLQFQFCRNTTDGANVAQINANSLLFLTQLV